ncbi:MAG: hypothetical protein GEV11_23775 [Streptosporangiales bacterium]|nr:hypothetical protein [Streptosporangiales bacterium]
MSPELISVLALVVMFVIATTMPINLGALALVGAGVVGLYVAGMSEDDILGQFPGDLFVTLVGVTYLFAIASNNGTVDWLVRAGVRAVSGRLVAIPLVMFLIAALLTGIGAAAPAVAAILAPIAFGFAYRYNIHPLLVGLAVAHGTQAGAFSPISVLGTIVSQVLDKSPQVPQNDLWLFLGSFIFNTAAIVIVFFLFGGPKLMGRREGDEDSGGGSEAASASRPATAGDAGAVKAPESASDLRLTMHQGFTLLGIVLLCVFTLALGLDVGLVAVTVAVALTLISPREGKGAVDKIAWPVVLLVGGVATYVGVLQEMGTVDFIGQGIAGMGTALVAALLICYLGGVVSAFASSVGIMSALIPLAVPFLVQGEIGAVGMVAAFAVSATIVDVSPFSTTGALLVANVQGMDRQVFYRRLLAYGAVIVAVGPLSAWLFLVAPGWL